ncbi:hypothetical protein [Pedobacter jeongneungensis]|uniref:hypothetical protein n=1 Tax=Pedobacter jeongneungensis TaxID=947309 RepID=UPI00046AA56E|nr:hypothetical protein [Pedobacter jeongneungensis]
MLYLEKPEQTQLDAYAKSLKKSVRSAVDSSNIPQEAKDFLDEERIVSILTDTPEKLIVHHNEFMPLLIKNFNENQYLAYLKARSLQKKLRNMAHDTLISVYEPTRQLLEIFDYERQISESKAKSYNLAKVLNRNTCTYCNRLYTNTVISKVEARQRENNDHRITRAQFDHWFARSVYPLLGISFFNLIPSCSVCNSSVKADDIFTLQTHIHPYIKEEQDAFSFSFVHQDLNEYNIKIEVEEDSKIFNHLTAFKIKEVYDAHSNMELRDLLDLKYKYPDNYIQTLFNDTFNSIDVSREEVHRMVFGAESEEQHYHKRPFSKLKNDILKEFLLFN